jgi:hypothetical protein
VEFLHRTIRDFLRDSYHGKLEGYLRSDFNPLVSLYKICLSLLKALAMDNLQDRETLHRVIGLSDELLYYAHEVEKRGGVREELVVHALLDELDVVNCNHAQRETVHWTQARDIPGSRGLDRYEEGGKCNFLALALQARLVKYVRAKLQSAPERMEKSGRPLLNYALRPRRSTPISMSHYSTRDDQNVDPDMVEVLLAHGANANPNKPVRLYNGRSVWDLFLISIHEGNKQLEPRTSSSQSPKMAWY